MIAAGGAIVGATPCHATAIVMIPVPGMIAPVLSSNSVAASYETQPRAPAQVHDQHAEHVGGDEDQQDEAHRGAVIRDS